LDEEQHPQAACEDEKVRNSRQASGQRWTTQYTLMKTSTQLSRWWWVRKTNLRAIEQSQKFYVRRGSIGRQFRGLFTKTCVSSAGRKGALTHDFRKKHAGVIFGI